MSSPRQDAKAHRRAELLASAARQFARRGFHAATLGDIAAEAGVSAPAVYRHFASKADLLAQLLIGVSRSLVAGGERAAATERPLASLVHFHATFAVRNADVIRVQGRELDAMDEEARHEVRRLQNAYVAGWVAHLLEALPGLGDDEARFRVHAAFGLMNSTPHSLRRGSSTEDPVGLLASQAMAALGAERSVVTNPHGSRAAVG